MAYEHLMGKEQDTNDLPKDSPPDGTVKVAEGLPLAPQGSIARIGQDTYRRETSRDSVTGSFRTQAEAKGLATTRK